MSIKFTKEQIDSLSKVIREVMDASERYSFDCMVFSKDIWEITVGDGNMPSQIKQIEIRCKMRFNSEMVYFIKFDKEDYEVWNTPVIDEDSVRRIKEILPWKV